MDPQYLSEGHVLHFPKKGLNQLHMGDPSIHLKTGPNAGVLNAMRVPTIWFVFTLGTLI